MHDIRNIRADPAAFDAALARRGADVQSASILELDRVERLYKTQLQKLIAEKNRIGPLTYRLGAKSDRSDDENFQLNQMQDRLPQLNAELDNIEDKAVESLIPLRSALLALPNLAAADVPDGADEHANALVHERGAKPVFDFTPLEHDVLAAPLGYDPDVAAQIAGARFAVLRGGLARLHRALGQWMLDVQTREHGYIEIAPPLLVRGHAMVGTGQLPKFAEDSFHTTDDRWLIPTAEVSLTNLVRERILADAELPLRFAALTPCFRQEAGSAGKDTRGLIRQHQFDKVELVAIVRPQDSEAEHERLTSHAEAILDKLGLAYRRMLLCAGDMGFSAKKTYDLEVWLPGQARWREISSCSNCGDFQARRMDARFRVPGGKPEFVHTLNGSGLAVGRALVAVLENYQRADGGVAVPEALLPYMAGLDALTPGHANAKAP